MKIMKKNRVQRKRNHCLEKEKARESKKQTTNIFHFVFY